MQEGGYKIFSSELEADKKSEMSEKGCQSVIEAWQPKWWKKIISLTFKILETASLRNNLLSPRFFSDDKWSSIFYRWQIPEERMKAKLLHQKLLLNLLIINWDNLASLSVPCWKLPSSFHHFLHSLLLKLNFGRRWLVGCLSRRSKHPMDSHSSLFLSPVVVDKWSPTPYASF